MGEWAVGVLFSSLSLLVLSVSMLSVSVLSVSVLSVFYLLAPVRVGLGDVGMCG